MKLFSTAMSKQDFFKISDVLAECCSLLTNFIYVLYSGKEIGSARRFQAEQRRGHY